MAKHQTESVPPAQTNAGKKGRGGAEYSCHTRRSRYPNMDWPDFRGGDEFVYGTVQENLPCFGVTLVVFRGRSSAKSAIRTKRAGPGI